MKYSTESEVLSKSMSFYSRRLNLDLQSKFTKVSSSTVNLSVKPVHIPPIRSQQEYDAILRRLDIVTSHSRFVS